LTKKNFSLDNGFFRSKMLEWDYEVTYKLIKLEKKKFHGKKIFFSKMYK